MSALTNSELRLTDGGCVARFQRLLDSQRPRLERLIALYLDLRLRARFYPSDIVEGVIAQGLHQRGDFLCTAQRVLYVWLREMALQRLAELHARHLPSNAHASPAIHDNWEQILAVHLSALCSINPTRLDYRQRRALKAALSVMDAADQELLKMRFLEGLGIAELAAVLNIDGQAAAARYLHAVDRLNSAASGVVHVNLPTTRHSRARRRSAI